MGAAASLKENFEEAVLFCIKHVRSREGREECKIRLSSRLTNFRGKNYHSPGSQVIMVTKEGKTAVKDAVNFLSQTSAVDFNQYDFSLSSCIPLRLSSEDHAFDVGSLGATSHTGSDGSSTRERIERYALWQVKCSEVIWYGRIDDRNSAAQIAEEIIDDLIVDDGVPDRGHRQAIFDPVLKIAGVGLFTHSVFGHVCVVNMAAAVLEEGKAIGDRDTALRVSELAKCCRARIESGPKIPAKLSSVSSTPTQRDTQWQNLGACFRCKELIRGGRVIEVPRKKGTIMKFHDKCYLCFSCAKSIQGQNVSETDDGNLVCRICYDLEFAPICARCSSRITDMKWTKSQDKSYHVPCFEELIKEQRKMVVVAFSPVVSSSAIKSVQGGSTTADNRSFQSMDKAKKKLLSVTNEYTAI